NDSGAMLPATLMPCVNCHQYDGRGIPEGGITPADIRWFNLTKPYGISRKSGETHPPYTQRSIKTAITMGIDSGGQKLNSIMPRYQLTLKDMQDLVAFLTGLGSYQASGISDTHIDIGVILPRENPDKALAVKQILNAYFADLNQQGGIFQRQFRLVFIAPELSPAALKNQLTQSNVFAFVASDLQGIETLVADFSKTSGVPVIGALSSTPLLDFPPNRNIFYLLSGQNNQTRALQAFAQRIDSAEKTASKTVVLMEKTPTFEALTKHFSSAKPQVKLDVISFDSAKGLATTMARLQQHQVKVVYLLASQSSQARFFQQASVLKWWPNVLLPGSQMSGALFNSPAQFDQRIFVAMPNLPFDYSKDGINDYKRLQTGHKVMPQYRNSQLLAMAAAKLLKEGLTKIGRSMEQPKLVAMMEGVYRFDTQLTPRISFGPNRRLGASGAYIVTLDLVNKTIRPVSDWLEVK
ncbi:MAG: ABC-type branched-subunit amino acid transport system substrate-binding protein, partial [Phenylobacterium sp.]